MTRRHAFIHRIPVRGLLAVAALGCFQVAHSADVPVPYIPVEQKQYGNTYQWTPAKAAPNNSGALYGPNRGYSEISNAQPKINTYQRLPYDKRPDIPQSQMAKIASPFTKANFGKALTAAGRAAWPVGVILSAGEIYQYFKDSGVSNVRNTPDGVVGDIVTEGYSDPDYVYYAPSAYGVSASTKFSSAQAVCSAIAAALNASGAPDNTYSLTSCSVGTGAQFNRSYKGNPAGQYSYGVSRQATPCTSDTVWNTGEQKCKVASLTTLTQQQLEDRIASESGWPSRAPAALAEALKVPGVTLKTETPTVTGPSTTPGTTETVSRSSQVGEGTTTEVPAGTPGAQPATVTTTTTSTTNNNYTNNQVTTTTTKTTNNSVTNNVTNTTNVTNPPNTTTETTDKPPEQDICEKYPDSAMCKPAEEKTDFCEKNPDVLACQKPELDKPDVEIPKSEKTLTYTEEDSFGGGNCPSDVFANINGQSIKVYDWAQTCGYVNYYLRPLILLLGAMGALFILIPGRD